MTKALEIARFFIELGTAQAEREAGDGMTNLRLNKMLYFAQAYSLVRLGYPLFPDKIEAWKRGPVIPNVYYHYRENGANPLTDKPFNRETVSSEEFDLLFDVFRNLEKVSTSGLIDKTHEEGSPWANVYEEGKNNEISDALIKEYFKDRIPPQSKLCSRVRIYEPLYRDASGVPVFPREALYG